MSRSPFRVKPPFKLVLNTSLMFGRVEEEQEPPAAPVEDGESSVPTGFQPNP